MTARVYYVDGSSWAINDGRAIDWVESSLDIEEVVVVHDSVRNVDRVEARVWSPGTATLDARVNVCWVCTRCIDVTLGLVRQIQVTVSLPRLRAGASLGAYLQIFAWGGRSYQQVNPLVDGHFFRV